MAKCLKCGAETFDSRDGYIVCSNENCQTVHSKTGEILKDQPKIPPLNPNKFQARDTITNELTPNLVEIFKGKTLKKILAKDDDTSLILRNKLLFVMSDESILPSFSDKAEDYKKITTWTQHKNGMTNITTPKQKLLLVLE